jgi:hypothetical protein
MKWAIGASALVLGGIVDEEGGRSTIAEKGYHLLLAM